VDVVEGEGHLDEEVEHHLLWEVLARRRVPPHHLRQVAAVAQVHHNVDRIVSHKMVTVLHDARVGEALQKLDLARRLA
jgi:hypothetical protein